jgi:long-chain acyl-CoA synthetase
MLSRLKSPSQIFPSLKVLVSGGSYLSADNHNLITGSFGVEVLNGYGLTEIAPVTANLRNAGKSGTLGEICRGLSGRIESFADSEMGEIAVKAEDSFLGYLGRPEETAEAMEHGWFKTGDLGRIEDGHVVFGGELKRTRKVNGQIVDLKEVETALVETGLVDRAMVSGNTNHISAEVSVNGPHDVNEKETVRNIRNRLTDLVAVYKIPRTIDVVPGE